MSGVVDTWSSLSGQWTDGANWSNATPGAASDATFAGATPYVVTYATNDTINQLNASNPLATLDLVSGFLEVTGGGTYDGALIQTGGTLEVGNNHTQYLTLSGTVQLGGTIQPPGSFTDELYLTGSTDLSGLTDINLTLNITGPASLTSSMTLDGYVSMPIYGAGVLNIVGNTGISGGFIGNENLFEKISGGGLSQISGAFTNNASVVVTSGAMQFQGEVSNNGTFTIGTGSTIDFRAPLTGIVPGVPAIALPGSIAVTETISPGDLLLAASAMVEMDAAVDTTQTVDFTGSDDVLALSDLSAFRGLLAGFSAGDTIDLLGLAATTASDANGTLTISNGATVLGTVALLGVVSNASRLIAYTLTSDGSGGTDVSIAGMTTLPVTSGTAQGAAADITAFLGAFADSASPNVTATSTTTGLEPALTGYLNIADFSNFASGVSETLPSDYQIGELSGGTLAATLTDGGTGGVLLIGNNGNDTIIGSGHSDSLVGGAGNNTLTLGAGAGAVTTGSGSNLILLGAGPDTISANGTDTLLAGAGAATVTASAASLMFGAGGGLSFVNGRAASTVLGGSGSAVFASGAGGGVYYGAGGGTEFVGGAGSATFVGGAGSTTLFGGTGGGIYFDGSGGGVFVNGSAGNNIAVVGAGPSTVFGGNAGDQIYMVGTNTAVAVAGLGNETLNGASSSAGDGLYAGAGNDLILGGSGNDIIVGSTGSATMSGGAGTNLFVFFKGDAGGSNVINDFTGSDLFALVGYGSELTSDLAAQQQTQAGTMLTLSDHTTILFSGVSLLSAQNFLSF